MNRPTLRKTGDDGTRTLLGPGVIVRVTVGGKTWQGVAGLNVKRYVTKAGEVYEVALPDAVEVPR